MYDLSVKSIAYEYFWQKEDDIMFAQTAYPVIDLEKTGRCIERQRRQAGLTVRELQSYFGFEYPQAIYKWQHGECLPTVDNLLALARLLQVPMEDLLVYEDQGVVHFCGTKDAFEKRRLALRVKSDFEHSIKIEKKAVVLYY